MITLTSFVSFCMMQLNIFKALLGINGHILSNSYCTIMNKIFMYAWPAVLNNNDVCMQFQKSCKISIEFLLFKFWQGEDYSEQSKLYFEPLKFAWQRCSLQREYFCFLCLHISLSIFTLFAYNFIIINLKKQIFFN